MGKTNANRNMKPVTLTSKEEKRIAAEIDCDVRTVKTVLRGGGKTISKEAVRLAMLKLGYPGAPPGMEGIS